MSEAANTVCVLAQRIRGLGRVDAAKFLNELLTEWKAISHSEGYRKGVEDSVSHAESAMVGHHLAGTKDVAVACGDIIRRIRALTTKEGD